jgi:hypothetical protein
MMLRQLERAEQNDDDVDLSSDDGIYCAACDTLITRGRWRLVVNEDHEHTLFNPHGKVFRVVCFKEASGVADHGDFSDEFTWFKGYSWILGLCQGCGTHLGWRYQGASTPKVFFGLIKSKLTIQH